MFPQIITYLLTLINYQEQVIRTLLTLLIGKSMFEEPKETPVNKPYRKLQVDDLPIIEQPEKLDYRALLKEFQEAKGKPLKPVQRRKNSTPVPMSMNC
ncbi:transposase, partial [Schinkia azotoformans]|nr:transposase [Schinkia azotoformans]